MPHDDDQIKSRIRFVRRRLQRKEPNPLYAQFQKESEYRQEEIENLRSDRGLRKTFSTNTFCYMWFWTIAIFITLALQGFGFKDFKLDTKLLMVLVGSSMVKVISLSITTVRGIFGRK